jgi:hypothetical protein
MNARIKELAAEAGLQPFEDCGPGYVRKMEHFSSLIVRECATICKETAEVQFSPLYQRESDGADVCYRKIKERFGLDE